MVPGGRWAKVLRNSDYVTPGDLIIKENVTSLDSFMLKNLKLKRNGAETIHWQALKQFKLYNKKYLWKKKQLVERKAVRTLKQIFFYKPFLTNLMPQTIPASHEQ